MICSSKFEGFANHILRNSTMPQTAEKLRTLARFVAVSKGAAAQLEGSDDLLVFIDKGATKLVAHASGGREQVVAFHFAGDLVSVPTHETLVYSLRALEDTQLAVFPARDFLAVASEDTGLLGEVLGRMMVALHRSREKALALGRKTARERVAGFLASMAQRIGKEDEHGWRIDLPMSRRDIGDSLGLTIETVSRQFSEMRCEGLVETSGRSAVRLMDSAALADRAGFVSTTQ